MLLDLQKILGSLGLVSSLLKPVPIIGNIVPGLVDTVDGLANKTLSGPLAGIIGPSGLVGGLIGNKGPLGSLLGDGSPLGAITGDSGLLSSLLFANTTLSMNITDILANHTASPNSNATVALSAINATLAQSNLTLTTNSTSGANATEILASLGNIFASQQSACTVTPYTPATPLVLESFAPYDPAQALVYRYRQQQSVNLGSWFVQEQWMNPSIFTCASGAQQAELDVASGWGGLANAQSVLEQHWDQWIQESDFEYLASIGINTVRLPIGYFSLGASFCAGTEFESVASVYTNAWPRVVRAINWASKYGLGVLVDFHAAPGSQNGQAHSGISTGEQNLFGNATNLAKTVDALTFLTQQLVSVNNVVGIELLNEPAEDPSLPAFYTSTLATLRHVTPAASAFPFYIHDAFDLTRFAEFNSNRTDFVVEDHHQYFVFGPSNETETATDISEDVATEISQDLTIASGEERRNLIVGEWSCALPTQSIQNASDADLLRQTFCTGQMQTFSNSSAGWHFWSYKTEMCATDPNWCFTARVGTSLPATFFSYPNGQALAPGFAAASVDGVYTGTTNTTSPDDLFAFGSSTNILQGLNTPDSATLLLAASSADAGTNNYYSVNEMLAAAPVPSSVTASATAPYTSSVAAPYTSSVTAASYVAPSAAAADINNNLAVGSGSHAATSLKGYKRSLQHALSHSAHKPTSHGRHHRHLARQLRRQQATTTDYTPQQAAIAQGYADGFKAAKTFALFGGSRLGFVGQFVSDAISSSPSITADVASYYQTWFLNGLADGEIQVLNALSGNGTAPAS